MARYVLIAKFCELTGYTDTAVRAKIRDEVWLEDQEYKKAPDGHIVIDMDGYELWVEKGLTKGFAPVAQKASRSISSTGKNVAGKHSGSPQPLQI